MGRNGPFCKVLGKVRKPNSSRCVERHTPHLSSFEGASVYQGTSSPGRRRRGKQKSLCCTSPPQRASHKSQSLTSRPRLSKSISPGHRAWKRNIDFDRYPPPTIPFGPHQKRTRALVRLIGLASPRTDRHGTTIRLAIPDRQISNGRSVGASINTLSFHQPQCPRTDRAAKAETFVRETTSQDCTRTPYRHKLPDPAPSRTSLLRLAYAPPMLQNRTPTQSLDFETTLCLKVYVVLRHSGISLNHHKCYPPQGGHQALSKKPRNAHSFQGAFDKLTKREGNQRSTIRNLSW